MDYKISDLNRTAPRLTSQRGANGRRDGGENEKVWSFLKLFPLTLCQNNFSPELIGIVYLSALLRPASDCSSIFVLDGLKGITRPFNAKWVDFTAAVASMLYF